MPKTPRDPVANDPGELIRFFLWYQHRLAARRLVLTDLARAIAIKPSTASAWIDRHGVPTYLWNPIAEYFGKLDQKGKPDYRLVEDEAALLWKFKKNRAGFTPLHQLKVKRQRATEGGSRGPRV